MKIRIGTRKSPLALWQANTVADKLQEKGYTTQLVEVECEGDQNLVQPLYEIGIVGVFTRALDIALINDKIDIAVHSLKDVPTLLPKGLALGGFLPRGNAKDCLVIKQDISADESSIVATGSLRRKAFLSNEFPKMSFVDLRGNVQTRLKKLEENNWNAAVFAKAGLERSALLPQIAKMGFTVVEWESMLPAASQGIVACAYNEIHENVADALASFSDNKAANFAAFERSFLRTTEGGCTLPIGVSSKISKNEYVAHGAVLSLNGQDRIDVTARFPLKDFAENGELLANTIIAKGGKVIIDKVKRDLNESA